VFVINLMRNELFKAQDCDMKQKNMTRKWGLVGAFMCEFNL